MDNKKIFDILPPQKKEDRPQKMEVKDFSKKIKKEEAVRPGQKKEIIGHYLVFTKILTFSVFLFAVFVSLSNFVFNKTEIRIWPETDKISLNENITVAIAGKTDVSKKIIIGQVFEENKIISREFFASGETKEGQKASGKIRVYNNYSDVPQVLVKNTRFISDKGNLFRTVEKITVPGGVYEKGKLQPGYIDVGVVADQAGEEYNIGPATFSIPGFVGTAKYTAFYGKSFEAMSDGFIGDVPQILSDDISKAKEILLASAIEEGKISLENKISSDFVLLKEAVSFEVISATSSLLAGAR